MSDEAPSLIVRALTVVVGHVLELIEQFDRALVSMDDPGGPFTLDDLASSTGIETLVQ